MESGDAGFSGYRLVPESFPEMSRSEVSTRVTFLGRDLSFPFLIAPMSGGTDAGRGLNRTLAQAAQASKVALGLGSMRPVLSDTGRLADYDVRSMAPDVPVLGNIAAWQLRDVEVRSKLAGLLDRLKLDGVFVHANPIQELMQPEGERDFSGAVAAVCAFAAVSPVPVLVREVGFGLCARHLSRLVEAGVSGFDVSGRGGTDFARVEALRSGDVESLDRARELLALGLPTAEALVVLCRALGDLVVLGAGARTPAGIGSRTGEIPVALSDGSSDIPAGAGRPTIIATGGIRTATDMALALGLGADLAGIGLPMLRAAGGGVEEVCRVLRVLRERLADLMLLSGASGVAELRGRVHARGARATSLVESE